MVEYLRQRPSMLFWWIAIGFVSLLGCQSESAYERDIQLRGPGSQAAWNEATGGHYNGDLPVD